MGSHSGSQNGDGCLLPFDFCLPARSPTVPATRDWLHEIKYDGYRLRLERDGDRVSTPCTAAGTTKRCSSAPSTSSSRAARTYKLPLLMRKTNLDRLLARRLEGIFVNPFEQGEIGPDLFQAACQMGLEGLVSKRRIVRIRPVGRSTGSRSRTASTRRRIGPDPVRQNAAVRS